jgi:hypothetical protein
LTGKADFLAQILHGKALELICREKAQNAQEKA